MNNRSRSRTVHQDQQASVLVRPEEVHAEVDRISSHPLFANAPMLQRFLRFSVEKTLEGAASELKEYTIGCEVFGRGTSFDPSQSSTVRTQAFNLRRRLKAFYQEQGAAYSFRIVFEPGSYAPVFAPAQSVSLPSEPAGRGPVKLSLQFSIVDVPAGGELLNRQIGELRSELIAQFTQSEHLRLLTAQPGSARPDFTAEAWPSLTDREGKIQVQVVDQRHGGFYLWSGAFSWDLVGFEARSVARRIQTELEQIIVNGSRSAERPSRRRDPKAEQACSDAAAYLTRFTAADCGRAQQSFRSAVEAAPDEADGYAGFALAAMQAQFLQDASSGAKAVEARIGAAHAIALDANSAAAQLARGSMVALLDWDLTTAAEYFGRAERLSGGKWPDGTCGVAHALLYLVPRSQFGEAVDELQALSRNFPADQFVRYALGLSLLFGGREAEALATFERMREMDDRCGMAALGAARVLAGQRGQEERARKNLQAAESILGRTPAVLGLESYLAGVEDDTALQASIEAELLALMTPYERCNFERALLAMGRGQREEAMFLLEEAVRSKEPAAMFWRQDPLFAALSVQPESRQLAESVR
jgi:hypothetical protein